MSKAAKKQEKQEKQEWAIEKPKLDNARKLRGIQFIDLEDEVNEETIFLRKKEIGNFFGSCHVLQDGDKKTLEGAAGNVSEWIHSPTQENRLCLCCGSSRIYKEAFGVYSSEKSRGSYRRERVQFSYSLTIWCINLFKCPKR